MIVKMMAVRSYRREFVRAVKAGTAALRVQGSEREGFRLFAETATRLVPLHQNRTFRRQKDAIAYGEEKFGVKARKITKAA